MFRADARLRGRQNSEVAVRKIPRRGREPWGADEVGWRSDGDRSHLQRSADERYSLARYRKTRRWRQNRAEDPDATPGDAASGAVGLRAVRSATGAHGEADREDDLDGSVVPLPTRSEEHTSELQSPCNLVCRLLLEK